MLGHLMCLCDSWRNCCVCPFFIVVFGHCVGTVGTAANEGSLCLLGEKQRVPEGKMFGHVGLKFWNGQRTNISHCCTGRLQGRHIYKKKNKKSVVFWRLLTCRKSPKNAECRASLEGQPGHGEICSKPFSFWSSLTQQIQISFSKCYLIPGALLKH